MKTKSEMKEFFQSILKDNKYVNDDIIDSLVNIFDGSQVKDAEPKVLSIDEIWDKYPKHLEDMEGDDAIYFGKMCHQNGRLERDLELRPLVELWEEAILLKIQSDFINWDSFTRIAEEKIKNLKPLNKNE